MLTPEQLKALPVYPNKSRFSEIIQDIDEAIKRAHGRYPYEQAILDYELPMDIRNEIAKEYVATGWNYTQYVYHYTSSEHKERSGLTAFYFSATPLTHMYNTTQVTKDGIERIE